jgi:hypothetical protein
VKQMDWRGKSWIEEDAEFAPKRKVNNKGSRYFRLLSGFLISQKMSRRKVWIRVFMGGMFILLHIGDGPICRSIL